MTWPKDAQWPWASGDVASCNSKTVDFETGKREAQPSLSGSTSLTLALLEGQGRIHLGARQLGTQGQAQPKRVGWTKRPSFFLGLGAWRGQKLSRAWRTGTGEAQLRKEAWNWEQGSFHCPHFGYRQDFLSKEEEVHKDDDSAIATTILTCTVQSCINRYPLVEAYANPFPSWPTPKPWIPSRRRRHS